MKKTWIIHSILAGLCVWVFFGFATDYLSPNSTDEKGAVNWLTMEEAAQLAEQDGKKILVDMYTDWCGWCKVMDRNTYSNQEIADYINTNFHPVKMDAQQKESLTLNGKTYGLRGEGRRGYNEFAIQVLGGKMSFPSTVFLNSDLSVLFVVPGYLKPNEFSPILSYTYEEAYKEKSFQEYQKSSR